MFHWRVKPAGLACKVWEMQCNAMGSDSLGVETERNHAEEMPPSHTSHNRDFIWAPSFGNCLFFFQSGHQLAIYTPD